MESEFVPHWRLGNGKSYLSFLSCSPAPPSPLPSPVSLSPSFLSLLGASTNSELGAHQAPSHSGHPPHAPWVLSHLSTQQGKWAQVGSGSDSWRCWEDLRRPQQMLFDTLTCCLRCQQPGQGTREYPRCGGGLHASSHSHVREERGGGPLSISSSHWKDQRVDS